jgi:hypothetical protein
MAEIVFWILILAALLVVLAAVIWARMIYRGRQLGTRGIVQRSHLVCPRCHRDFDYDWIPGVSFTTIRLGTGRYMACPLCHRWSFFNLYRTLVARPSPRT